NHAGDDRPGVFSSGFTAAFTSWLGHVFAAVSAHRALHTGYSPGLWFGLGLLLNALAYILLLTRPKRDVYTPAGVPSGLGKIAVTHAPQRCPPMRRVQPPFRCALSGLFPRKTFSPAVTTLIVEGCSRNHLY